MASTSPYRNGLLGGTVLRNIGCTVVLLVMVLFVLYPLVLLIYGSLLVETVNGTRKFGFDTWIDAWQQPGMVQAITNTLKRVLLTEAISLPLAVLIAWLVARTQEPK